MQNGELTHALGESAVLPKSSILILSDDSKHFYADVRFIEERLHPFSQLFSFRVNLTFFGNGGQNPKTNHKLNVRRVLFVCNNSRQRCAFVHSTVFVTTPVCPRVVVSRPSTTVVTRIRLNLWSVLKTKCQFYFFTR